MLPLGYLQLKACADCCHYWGPVSAFLQPSPLHPCDSLAHALGVRQWRCRKSASSSHESCQQEGSGLSPGLLWLAAMVQDSGCHYTWWWWEQLDGKHFCPASSSWLCLLTSSLLSHTKNNFNLIIFVFQMTKLSWLTQKGIPVVRIRLRPLL